MVLAVWPSAVNAYAVRDTYTDKAERNVSAFQPEQGDPLERRRTTRRTSLIGYDARYTSAEWDALNDGFYRDTLQDGVLPFALVNPYNRRLGVYKFTAPPELRTVNSLKIRAGIALRRLSEVEAETQILLNAMAVAPSADRALIINNAIYGLKKTGLWAKATALYFLAAHDAQAARLNLKAPAATAASEVNAPTFTIDGGYDGDGTTSYLDCGIAANVLLAQDNASMFAWPVENVQIGTTAADVGVLNVASNRVNARDTSDLFDAQANSVSTVTSANTDARKLIGWSRSAAGSYLTYLGTAGTARSDVSSAVSSANLTLLRAVGFSSRRLGFAGTFTFLSAADVAALYSVVRVYLKQVGAI